MHLRNVLFKTTDRFNVLVPILLLITMLFMSNCSNNSDENSDSVEIPILKFTSPSSITVIENQKTALTLTAVERDGNTVSYTISNGDAASFDVNSSTGVVAFKTAPDYESKNKYTFVATASNGNDAITQNITIKIEDYNNPFLVQRLQDNNETSDGFGASISTDGNYTVIGSTGYAYLYKMDIDHSMRLITKFKADDNNVTYSFGWRASISGKYIVISDVSDNSKGSNAGCAYLFKIGEDETVAQIAKIQADDTEADDYFGSSVSLAGNYIAVGARGKSTVAANAGSAYLFKIAPDDTVSQVAAVQADVVQKDAYFGNSITLNRNYLVVGAYIEDTTAVNTGSVYIYKITSDDTVSQIGKISASNAQENDYFGVSVAIDDVYVVVGATGKDTTATDAGSAYVYKIAADDTVSQIAIIEADDAAYGDRLGNAISIDNRNIVIGASSANEIGSVYLYKLDENDRIVKVKTIDSIATRGDDTYFGASVSISGDIMAVGAPYEDLPDYDAGRVYVFDSEPLNKIYVYNDMPDKVDMDEGTLKDVYTIEAGSPKGLITYNITGPDSDSFVLTGDKITVDSALDYETPEDSDANNSYNISIELQDDQGNQLAYPLTVDVHDRHHIDLAKIQASDAEAYDSYGEAVAIDGNYTVVGAPDEDTTASKAGSVYVYKKATNGDVVQIAKIQASDAEASDGFGGAVAIDGKYIIVGASGEDTTASGAGSVYIFKIADDDTVSQVTKIQAQDASSASAFGISVSISGAYLAVGAENSTYILKIGANDTVTQLAKVRGSDTGVNDVFGLSVSISGNYIAVGSWHEKSTYIFKIASDDSVSQVAKIHSNVAGDTYFGQSVSISGRYIVVGAKGESDSSGSVYLYKIADDNSVSQLSRLVAKDTSYYDHFGDALAIDGKYIVVGAKYENSTAFEAGAAYVFEMVTDASILQVDKIQAYDAELFDDFGCAVAISGDDIVIGSKDEDTTGVSADDRTSPTVNAGSAYIYTKDPNQ